MKAISITLKHFYTLFGALYLSVLLFTSCSDNDDNKEDEDNGGGTSTPTLSLSPKVTDIVFSATATEDYTYEVTTNQTEWNVEVAPATATWCTVKKSSDGKSFSVKATQNEENVVPEKATITVTAGKAKTISFSATQDKAYSIYIAGYEDDAVSSGHLYTTYWIDGQKTTVGQTIGHESTINRNHILSVSGKDVYTIGIEKKGNLDIACYWKNGEKNILGTGITLSEARAIYAHNTDVFVAGTEYNSDNKSIACYWKNNKKIALGDETNSTWSLDITVSGNDVYILGVEEASSDEMAPPFYWKNGEKIAITGATAGDQAYSILVDKNDVYIIGKSSDEEYSTNACYWKNGEKIVLSDGVDDCAKDIFIDGDDVYISGYINAVACYWKNGEKVMLDEESKMSLGTSICVWNNDVYVAGHDSNSEDASNACFWKNGKKTTLSNLYSFVGCITVQ